MIESLNCWIDETLKTNHRDLKDNIWTSDDKQTIIAYCDGYKTALRHVKTFIADEVELMDSESVNG